jgi:predicted secreted Zn-dependent protease
LKSPSALLLITALASSAEVLALEKCVDAAGNISYVDVCPKGTTRAPSKTDELLIPKTPPGTTVIKPEIQPIPEASPGAPVTVRPIPPPPPPPVPPPAAVLAEVPKDVQLSYYDVEGADQASLLAALNARGTTQGQASWKLTYQYAPKRGMRECTVGTVSTKLELGMTLPRWAPPTGTAPELIARWERFLKALVTHQNARLEHARELERALGPALAALEPARDCPTLDAAVKERYAGLEEQARAKAQEPAAEIVFE